MHNSCNLEEAPAKVHNHSCRLWRHRAPLAAQPLDPDLLAGGLAIQLTVEAALHTVVSRRAAQGMRVRR